jgi:hypothetical protein
MRNVKKKGGEPIINNTRIKYIQVENKVYKISDISFFDFHINAREIGTDKAVIPVEEIFDISELKEFKIKLANKNGQAEIVSLDKWKRGKNKQMKL